MARLAEFFGPFWLLLPVLCLVALASGFGAVRLGARGADAVGVVAVTVLAAGAVWLPGKIFVTTVRFGNLLSLVAGAILTVIAFTGLLTALAARGSRQPGLIVWRRGATAVLIAGILVDTLAAAAVAALIWAVARSTWTF